MDKELILGIDIGGSHISAALVNRADGSVQKESFCKKEVNAHEVSEVIFEQWTEAIETTLSNISFSSVQGIGISMPGPFDYHSGVSLIKDVNKYEQLYGLNIRERLKKKLGLDDNLPILFENDAVCFGLGASLAKEVAHFKRVIAITLGTGLGATFLHLGKAQKHGAGVPPEGYLYNVPYKTGIAEDYFSASWIVDSFNSISNKFVKEAKEVYDLASLYNDSTAQKIFQVYGRNLGTFLVPWIKQFNAECLIIGGNLGKASALFLPDMQQVFEEEQLFPFLKIFGETELAAISGAATLVHGKKDHENNAQGKLSWRKTTQPILPASTNEIAPQKGGYDMYPYTSLGNGKIFKGYDSLAEWITSQKTVLIDGYVGVDWDVFEANCSRYFQKKNIRVKWWRTAAYLRPRNQIEYLVQPFLGKPGSVCGKKTILALEDFFKVEQIQTLTPDLSCTVNIVIGIGAALCHWNVPVIYVDLPKNELQYRMRAGSVTNLGCKELAAPAEMYKRFYFVDWVVLNAHRNQIKSRIMAVGDGQRKDNLIWTHHISLKKGFKQICRNIIRVRPWFEAGAWGGQWMKKNIPALSQDEVNYAWSFELIVPENGIVFESDGLLLEVCFDWLMEYDHHAVLGRDAARFGLEFPIRFDFLDTFDGGNLSIQCHPTLDYIQDNFGENITQDETYYILDCTDDAQVYLGFQDKIKPEGFRAALEKSQSENVEVDIDAFVQKFPSKKHDLFLIPNGTVHSSGKNNLVLEISATPYIFTFKMYDWLRLDLNGEPRPINIDHAFQNLNFTRKGKKVVKELISKQVILAEEEGYRLVHLPTHKQHFYDVHRIEFAKEVTVQTKDRCHVLMLVEGDSVVVRTQNGEERIFHYAETFVVPAAAGSYILVNRSNKMLRVIKAFIK